jgi:glutaredoxin
MKKILKFLIVFAVFLLLPVSAKADEKVINIHLFYGNGCPHCAAEEEFLSDYLKDRTDVKLYKYEIWYDSHNQELLSKVQKEMGTTNKNGVPFTVIGKKTIVGYADGVTDEQIKDAINYYLNNDYRDYAGEITGKVKKTEVKEDTIKDESKTEDKKENKIEKADDIKDSNQTDENVTVPVLGKINAKKVSLPILAVVLGFVDGFNPCAMWILIFLITMLFNMKDRKKMWILGLTFILTSGIVYLMFMLAWLNLATFISKIAFIRLLIAVIALVVGLINVYKYIDSLKKKDEGCDVVDKKDRKKIMEKIISITHEKKFIIALLGIMVLAASVNIIELMCSIGIPLLFTQILAMNNLSTFSYMIYMFIYIFFFLIDDIVIFVISMVTLKVTGLSTKYTKYSHLVGGIIMLIIGLLLIIKPELLMFNF